MSKQRLSVVLATYNEANNLGTCLASVRDLADEIIVVDGSSEDSTREIAQNFGAKIFKVANHPMFHTNKQLAVDKATGDWVLQLDADEVVSPELKQEIKGVLRSAFSIQHSAFYIPRKNFFLGHWLRKGGQYPDEVIRFFQKGKAKFPQKSVHEQLKVEGSIGHLTGHLLHYTAPTLDRYLTNSNRYTSLTAQALADRQVKLNLAQESGLRVALHGIELFSIPPAPGYEPLRYEHLQAIFLREAKQKFIPALAIRLIQRKELDFSAWLL